MKTPQHTPKAVAAIPIEHALKIFRKAAGERKGPYTSWALTTGARRGELFCLKRTDIDFSAGTMHIARSLREGSSGFTESAPKSGKARTVPLAPIALEALRLHFEKEPEAEYLFTAEKGGPLRKSVFMRKT